MKIEKIRYNKKDIYYLFLLLPFLFPSTIGSLPYIGTIIKVFKIIVGLVTVYYTLKRHRMSRLLVLMSLFYGVICLSALMHGLQIDNWIIEILFLWLIDFMTHNKKSLDRFLRVYVKLYSFLMLINLATMIAFPKGLYASSAYSLNWFLGYKNVIVRLLLPYLTLMLTQKVMNGKNTRLTKTEIILFALTIVSIILSQSFNSIIGMVLFALLLLRVKLNKPVGKYIITKIFAIYCVTDFIMLKSNILLLFQNLIVNVLGKNGSERARVAIWNRTLNMISKSPIIGYGGITNEMYNFAFKISHPHNLLLYYLMLGGVAGIIILFMTMLLVESEALKNRDTIFITVNKLFVAMYCAYFVMGYMESLTGATMMIPMLVILYNMNKMKMESGNNENRFMHTV